MTSTPRRLVGLAGPQVSTTDLLRCVVPVGHLIEQSLTLTLFGIVTGVAPVVCSAACAANCCEHDQ